MPVKAVLHLRSNEPLNKLNVTPANVALNWNPFGHVAAGVQLQDAGHTIVVTPASPLAPDSNYNLILNGVA
ncbi:MAG TPA: hypothetical protein VGS58_06605, partial [Candidatus Sulfopaludibacter sp.]|nr:hypothetical protein [Candidatus Sulfopaludibacter sp.]